MTVPSQLSPGDVDMLRSIMRFMAARSSYAYLEIGSYLGASLQWHLNEPACTKILSVDKRSTSKILDERNIDYAYAVTTQDMLKTLRDHDLPLQKLETLDGTTADLAPQGRFDLVFIDAEHTNGAVIEDGKRCHAVMSPNSVMLFHDDWIVYAGIESLEKHFLDNQIKMIKIKLSRCDITAFVFGDLIEPFQSEMQGRSQPWDRLVEAAQKKLPKSL